MRKHWTQNCILEIKSAQGHEEKMTTPTAMHQVLQLPELLEIILLNLSQRDLLLSQRTSTHFRGTITSSPKLQRALFLLADTSPLLPPFANTLARHPGRKPENNRLLLKAFPGVLPTTSHVLIRTLRPGLSPQDSHAPTIDYYAWSLSISFPSLPSDSAPAVLEPTASWRRMYLCQPPCTALHHVRRWRRSEKPAVVRDRGITMGDFVDEAVGWGEGLVSSDGDWHFEGVVGTGGEEDVR